ncbi:MAG: UDP-N-acetylglucosamine 2-epimerase [Tepidisphaeraceae bacterium]
MSHTMTATKRRVCFVTGTRAEFGLMRRALRAVQSHPNVHLQLIVTGMHLDARHGHTIDDIRRERWRIDATVPWRAAAKDPDATAASTGLAIAGLARAFAKLNPDVVLVVGDRVEAFAAAAAAHVGQRAVAHVHGGDKAQGQVDDALRHAITKLAHLHFPATRRSAARIKRLGEVPANIHVVGAPGLDGIEGEPLTLAELRAIVPDLRRHLFALLVLHPDDPSDQLAFDRATMLLRASERIGFERLVIVAPNNDPGAAGTFRAWDRAAKRPNVSLHRDLPRRAFLALLRDAAVLAGNSSAGIVEAASFGTPVVNVGPRQLGRERSKNVTDVPWTETAIRRALVKVWNRGRPVRFTGRNVYGDAGAGERIAAILGRVPLDGALRRKLIAY